MVMNLMVKMMIHVPLIAAFGFNAPVTMGHEKGEEKYRIHLSLENDNAF